MTGFSFNFIELFWITNSIAGFTSLPQYLVTIIMSLLALYMALYLALFTGLWHYLRNLPAWQSTFGGVFSALTVAAAWILFEDLRSSLLGGFPWNPLGLTQIDNQLCNWLFPWGGVRLLSGLVVIFSTGLYLSADALCKKKYKNASLYALFLLVPIVCIALTATAGTPTNMSAQPLKQISKISKATKIVVIQPNIPQKEKWLPENREKLIDKMISMTLQSIKERPDLIIWPEAALPLLLEKERALSEHLQKLVILENTSLMLGGPRYLSVASKKELDKTDLGETQKKLFNSIFLFTPNRPLQIYNKIKLVPYGEFTPLADFFPFISKIVPGTSYSPGDKIHNLTLKQLKIAPSVCFEGVFPAFTAHFFGAGANILINLTNDAWFGNSPGPRQHLLNIRLRALENNSYIIRCANTGISAIINPQGKIEKALPLNQEGLLKALVTPSDQATFYALHPNLPTFVAGLIAISALLLTIFYRQKI